MPGCAAIECTNSAKKGFLMKHFPKDPQRRKLWLVKLKRDNWVPINYSCICEKVEYIDLSRLKKADFDEEFKKLADKMRTKGRTMNKSITKKSVQKRPVGRPRKSKVKSEPLSDISSESISMHKTAEKIKICQSIKPLKCSPVISDVQVKSGSLSDISLESISMHKTAEKIKICRSIKPLKCSPVTSDIQICSTKPLENIVKQSTIAKTTSELLRNMLLSTDRTRIKRNTSEINSSYTTSYHNCNQYDTSKLQKVSSFNENSCKMKWKNNNKKSNLSTKYIKTTISEHRYPLDLRSFPDIPQLADVDINASFELDNSNYSISVEATDINTGLCINDADTLSNQSTQSAKHSEQDLQDFNDSWTLSMESGEVATPMDNCEMSFNELVDDSLFGPQDIALIQNDVIQNYIETNNVQFMQLPDSNLEVIKTLQYYEYESGLSTNPPQSSPEHLQDIIESTPNEQTSQHEQTTTEINHPVAESAGMLPCPIAGCLWYSHSVTLYVHLFTCHKEMIDYGTTITHIFKCQDIQNFCFFTHLQYVQNTIYIITITSDRYKNRFVSTIQHISPYDDNTSVSPTTAILTTNCHINIDQNSWSGQVQPYSTPLDVLYNDGRCLLIDSTGTENVAIKVNLVVP